MTQVAPTPLSSVSGDQKGIFSYFHFNPIVHTHEKPFEILINLPSIEEDPSGFRRTNQEFEDCSITVEDVRGREQDFSLDQNGFSWRKWRGPQEWVGISASEVKEKGHPWIREGYIKEVEETIKAEVQKQDGHPVDFVKVFDYKLRNSSDMKDFNSRTLDLDDGLDTMIPVTHPHVDQSFDGAVTRLRVHMGADADRLMRRRFRVINLWKPLKTVTNWPLAMCDTRTVQRDDLITTDLVRRKYVGETFYATFKEEHRWYYLSNQTPDDVVLLKIYDSHEDAKVRFCLHSSFHLEGVKDTGRESFEVRAFVFDPEG